MRNMFWRRILAGISILLLVPAGWQVYSLVDNARQLGGNAVIDAIAYTEPVKTAVAQKLEGAKGLFQTSLLAVAVLWGLVIAKKDERVLGWGRADWPEGVMFLIANALFVASSYCYTDYTNAMATIHAVGSVQYDEPSELTIMDFRDQRINNLYVWQNRFWALAMIVTAVTLFSAHALKGHPEKVSEEKP